MFLRSRLPVSQTRRYLSTIADVSFTRSLVRRCTDLLVKGEHTCYRLFAVPSSKVACRKKTHSGSCRLRLQGHWVHLPEKLWHTRQHGGGGFCKGACCLSNQFAQSHRQVVRDHGRVGNFSSFLWPSRRVLFCQFRPLALNCGYRLCSRNLHGKTRDRTGATSPLDENRSHSRAMQLRSRHCAQRHQTPRKRWKSGGNGTRNGGTCGQRKTACWGLGGPCWISTG
jgi:hypothetical protein